MEWLDAVLAALNQCRKGCAGIARLGPDPYLTSMIGPAGPYRPHSPVTVSTPATPVSRHRRMPVPRRHDRARSATTVCSQTRGGTCGSSGPGGVGRGPGELADPPAGL